MKESVEHLRYLQEVINRSENTMNQALFGMPVNTNFLINQINRDFLAINYISEKHCPRKANCVKKVHQATIDCLMGRISEKKYEEILRDFGQKHNVRIPVFRKRQATNKNPFSEASKMFGLG